MDMFNLKSIKLMSSTTGWIKLLSPKGTELSQRGDLENVSPHNGQAHPIRDDLKMFSPHNRRTHPLEEDLKLSPK